MIKLKSLLIEEFEYKETDIIVGSINSNGKILVSQNPADAHAELFRKNPGWQSSAEKHYNWRYNKPKKTLFFWSTEVPKEYVDMVKDYIKSDGFDVSKVETIYSYKFGSPGFNSAVFHAHGGGRFDYVRENIDINRLFDNERYLDQVAEKFGYETDFSKVFWNFPSIPTLYHCTTPEKFEKIKIEGLKMGDESRGISNRHVGNAVFTTMEELEIPFFQSYYGNIVVMVNADQMKKDGFMPEVSKEPDWEQAEKIAFIMSRMGKEKEAAAFVDSSDQNTSGTVIVYSDIPAKYLSLYEGN